VDLSRDESMIVSAQQQSTLIIWTRPTNNSPFASSQTLNGHTSMVYTAKFNFDMSKIASTSLDLTMKIWSRQSNGSYVQTQSINNYMTYLNFDSNGILIANLFTAWKVDRAIIYSISVDCSLVDNSNGLQSSQGQCICNDLFVWDASYGCQI
jgi:WD40 repeat protein